MRERSDADTHKHTHMHAHYAGIKACTHARMHTYAHKPARMDAYMYTCERIPLPRQAESLAPNHRYHDQKLCVDGAIVEKHARWAGGAVNKHPELGCCACGRWKTDASSSVVKALKGIDDGAAPTNRSDAQSNSIVHTKALEGVADEVPCWSTKSPNVPWGNSPFCPAWPRYAHDNGSTLTAEQRALLRAAVRRAIAPFAQRGISRERCAPAPSQPADPLHSSTLLYPPLPPPLPPPPPPPPPPPTR